MSLKPIQHIMNAPQPSNKSGKAESSITKRTSDIAVDLFFKMATYYQKLWSIEYGNTPARDFLSIFAKITPQHVARALQKARQALSKGDKYPPSVGMLISWCESPTESEYAMILHRVTNREPENDIEQYICDQFGFGLRRINESYLERRLRHLYVVALELKKTKELPPLRCKDTKALPPIMKKSMTDMAVDEFAQSKRTHKLKARIDALINLKK